MERLLLPSVPFEDAGSVNPLAPTPQSCWSGFCTPETREVPLPTRLFSRPGTSQMEGFISPSSYPQHFHNEMSFVVTTTSVRGNKRQSDPDGIYGSDKDKQLPAKPGQHEWRNGEG